MKVNDTPLFDEKKYKRILADFDKSFKQLQDTQERLMAEHKKLWALMLLEVQQSNLAAEASLTMGSKALETFKKVVKPKPKAKPKGKPAQAPKKPRKPKTT